MSCIYTPGEVNSAAFASAATGGQAINYRRFGGRVGGSHTEVQRAICWAVVVQRPRGSLAVTSGVVEGVQNSLAGRQRWCPVNCRRRSGGRGGGEEEESEEREREKVDDDQKGRAQRQTKVGGA